MSMPRIVRECGQWFLNSSKVRDNQNGKTYQVEYRYAICYSLLNQLHPKPTAGSDPSLFTSVEKGEGQRVLEQLKEAMEANKPWCASNFVAAFPFEYRDESDRTHKGHVIVDKADGLFPLVLNQQQGRVKAYLEAIKDTIRLYDTHIYPLFVSINSVDDWTEDFQDKVETTIPWNIPPQNDPDEGEC